MVVNSFQRHLPDLPGGVERRLSVLRLGNPDAELPKEGVKLPAYRRYGNQRDLTENGEK